MATSTLDQVDAFVERAKAFAADAELKLSTLSLYLLNDGKDLDRLAEGGDIGTRKLARAVAELDRREREFKAKAKGKAKTRR